MEAQVQFSFCHEVISSWQKAENRWTQPTVVA